MECTTYFFIHSKNEKLIESLNEVFAGKTKDRGGAIKSFFQSKSTSIVLPDQFDFDRYEHSKCVIEASFISGSTVQSDFIKPLSKIIEYVYASITNDEDGPVEKFGFIEGKKIAPKEIIDYLKENVDPSQLCSVGRNIEAKKAASLDPNLSVLTAVMNKEGLEKIEFYLQQGGNPDTPNSSGQRALDRSIERSDAKTVELLLRYGASVANPPKKATVLSQAARFGSSKIIKLLLEHGADPNVYDKFFSTYPIEIIIENNLHEGLKHFVDAGAKLHGLPKMNNLVFVAASTFHNCLGKVHNKLKTFELLAANANLLKSMQDNKSQLIENLMFAFDRDMVATEKDIIYLEKIKELIRNI